MHLMVSPELLLCQQDGVYTFPRRCTSIWSFRVIYIAHVLFCLFVSVSAEEPSAANNRNWVLERHRNLLSTNQLYTTVGATAFTVPMGVTSITATLQGASGGDAPWESYDVNGYYIGTIYGYGGKGGTVTANIPVTPGEILQINVGGQGGIITAGSNGGGAGCPEQTKNPSGGGGGASDIRRSPYTLVDRLIVAGGGGGGFASYGAPGGAGGYPAGANGGAGTGSFLPPTGGTATSGGTATNLNTNCYGVGTFGVGASCCSGFGGGGGGGYWGGGNSYAAGGGGGSSTFSMVHLQSVPELRLQLDLDALLWYFTYLIPPDSLPLCRPICQVCLQRKTPP